MTFSEVNTGLWTINELMATLSSFFFPSRSFKRVRKPSGLLKSTGAYRLPSIVVTEGVKISSGGGWRAASSFSSTSIFY
jgi:hypothetical protein